MEILIVPEIADELRISETSVYRLIADGHLKAVNAGARRRVVSREELDRFIRGGGVHGNPEPTEPEPVNRNHEPVKPEPTGRAPSTMPAPPVGPTRRRAS